MEIVSSSNADSNDDQSLCQNSIKKVTLENQDVNTKSKSVPSAADIRGHPRRRRLSHRKGRRFEHLNALREIAFDLEDRLRQALTEGRISAESFDHLIDEKYVEPRKISPFESLLSANEKMKIWNDFIEMSEDEQSVFLSPSSEHITKAHRHHQHHHHHHSDISSPSVMDDSFFMCDYGNFATATPEKYDGWENVDAVTENLIDDKFFTSSSCKPLDKTTTTDVTIEKAIVPERDKKEEGDIDVRSAHPAATDDADAATSSTKEGKRYFRRIHGHIRKILNRRHLPLGILRHLEQEIISFFEEYPHSVFISEISNSYERLLLHALCQYMDLLSRSFDDPSSGSRHTQVENVSEIFYPPNPLLSDYLKDC